MISVPMKDVHFNIDKEKGVVVAFCDVDFQSKFKKDREKIADNVPGNKWNLATSIIWDLDFDGHEIFHAVGVARHNPEDEAPFNEEDGKQLAIARMMDNIYNAWLKLWMKNIEQIEIAHNAVQDYLDKVCEKVMNDLDRRGEKIKDMFDDDTRNENIY